MRKLWAPWRAEFILHVKKDECIFCAAPNRTDEEAYILYRGEHNFIILNIFPYNSGHLMIAPYSHKPSPEYLTSEEYNEMFELLQWSLRNLRSALRPDGFNIGFNVGRVAGAGYEGHLHMHVVPRWNGDTNFMPVLAETKVISVGMEKTYQLLKPLFTSKD
ncbi:MAG: HIT domain-containing protein [Thermotogae bacterium]|nr:HIT domain-containing protein [Thermotogota bacterium]